MKIHVGEEFPMKAGDVLRISYPRSKDQTLIQVGYQDDKGVWFGLSRFIPGATGNKPRIMDGDEGRKIFRDTSMDPLDRDRALNYEEDLVRVQWAKEYMDYLYVTGKFVPKDQVKPKAKSRFKKVRNGYEYLGGPGRDRDRGDYGFFGKGWRSERDG